MRQRVKWNVVAPVGLLALVLAGVAWFDLTTGGEATPAPPIGPIGTPVRGAYIAPTATPADQATARPRPTVVAPPETAQGTPAERDARRKLDLALLVETARTYKTANGGYPTTDGKVQTLCRYKELDQGCKLAQQLGGALPTDPLGGGYDYWYSSDGTTARFYISLEQAIAPPDQPCETNDAELVKHPNVICVTAS